MLTTADIQDYMPDVLDYGIIDLEPYFSKTRADIIRLLNIKWWPLRSRQQYNITIRGYEGGYYTEFDDDLITESQFTRAAAFHCLAYYILPALSQFDPGSDRFREMMSYYKERFEEEFNLVLEDGVEYDTNNDNIVTEAEKAPTHFGRLVR
jgi:hypothetical protein